MQSPPLLISGTNHPPVRKRLNQVIFCIGRVSYGIAAKLAHKMFLKAGAEGMVNKGFKLLSADSTTISFESLKTAVSSASMDISDDQVRFMIAEADTDGDGHISKDEFMNILLSCIYDLLFVTLLLKVRNVLEQ